MFRLISVLCCLGLIITINGLHHPGNEQESDEDSHENQGANTARWCVISEAEYRKCEDFSRVLTDLGLTPRIKCVISADVEGCLYTIRENNADLISLDGGDVFRAGKAFGMKPIMKEIYSGGSGYYGIAVVKTTNTDIQLTNLRGKRTCHTGIGRTAGWNIPVGYLLNSGQMPSLGCKESAKSAGHFFNASCAPGALLADKNPYGDNPLNLCARCKGDCGRSSEGEPYNGYSGAFRCMVEDNGDVAFIKPATVQANLIDNRPEWVDDLQSDDFRILCKDGTRTTIDNVTNCHISKGVSHAVLTSGEASEYQILEYQNLLTEAMEMFDSDTNEVFTMFDSTRWEGRNLMFKDYAVSMEALDLDTTVDSYLGGYGEGLEGLNKCPEGTLRFCTISDQEQAKCRAMREAFLGEGLEPEISCFPSTSHATCIDDIKAGFADVVTLDGGDIYRAGKDHGLKPIMGERYVKGKELLSYWAVAVVKSNTDFTINDLEGKRSCHTGIMKTSGWVMPVSFLISNDFISVENGITVPAAVGQFFNSSCVPGAKSNKYDLLGMNPDNLCRNCKGTDGNKCLRNDNEPYYDYSGAFRCLVENAGDVAFIKHTTVRDNTGKNTPDHWNLSRRPRQGHFQLLCPDGTRQRITRFRQCHLGEVPSHAMVTSGNKTMKEIRKIFELFQQATDIFKDDNRPGFKLFDSSGFEKDGEMIYYLDREGQSPGKNLLFKDSTINLKTISEEKRNFEDWLGPAYLTALERIQ